MGRESRDTLEIDMRRKVLLARIVENRRELVSAHRLQRVPGRAFLVAIIDQQGRAAVLHEPARDRRNGFIARRRRLDDLTVAVEREAPGRSGHAPFYAVHGLADRQRVEELIGDEQHR